MKTQTSNALPSALSIALLSIAIVLLSAFATTKAEVSVAYAPFASHFIDDDCCINDRVDFVSVSYNKIGAFTFMNSYNERSYGFKYEIDGPSMGPVSTSLFVGAVHGYHDKYIIDRETAKVVEKGNKAIFPIFAPTVSLNLDDNLSLFVSQFGSASTAGIRLAL